MGASSHRPPAISHQPSATGHRPSASLRRVPPVAVRVRPADVWRGLTALLHPEGACAEFRAALAEQLAPCALPAAPFLVSSGRAALALILLALKLRGGDRSPSRVAIPAYSCPTVVQAVWAAGLEPAFCDVSPLTLDLDHAALSRLVSRGVLAVVSTHLYGLAQDVAGVAEMGREQGFFVVEDAAQAFGARIDGRMVGTRGDAGFYSLGRGKCLPVGHGGIIVAQPFLEPALSEAMLRLGGHGGPPLRDLAMFLGYGVATHPWVWGLVARTRLNPAADGMDASAHPPLRLAGLGAGAAGIGLSVLSRLAEVQATWKRNARRLMDLLAGFDYVTLPEIPPGADPVFLRLPLVTDTAERAGRLLALLWGEGIGVSRSYYRTLPELYAGQLAARPGCEYPGAERLATCLLTLPTNSYLRDEDFARIARALKRA